MAKCALTGRKVSFGHNVSHAKNRTNRSFKPNVHKHRVFVPELGTEVTLKLSAKGLRTVTKKGLVAALRDEGLTLKDVL